MQTIRSYQAYKKNLRLAVRDCEVWERLVKIHGKCGGAFPSPYVTLFQLLCFPNPFKLLTSHFGFGWKSKASVFLLKPVQPHELMVWVVVEGRRLGLRWWRPKPVLLHSFPFALNCLCDKP